MQWFYNFTLKSKLLTGFISVAVVAALIGGIGIYFIKKIAHADTMLYISGAEPLGQLANISTAFQRIRVNARDIIAASSMEDKQKFAGRIKELRAEISKESEIGRAHV